MQKRVILKTYISIIVLSVGIGVGLNVLLMVIDLAQYSKAYQEAVKQFYAPSLWIQLLSTGMIIPILEEIVFRGFAFRLLRKWLPFIWAMILTSLLFGFSHGNLVQFVYATLCGFYLAYLCERFGSILPSIVAHMTMNITACVMTEFGLFTWIFETEVRVVFAILLCIGIAGIWLFNIHKLDVTKMLKKDCKK